MEGEMEGKEGTKNTEIKLTLNECALVSCKSSADVCHAYIYIRMGIP